MSKKGISLMILVITITLLLVLLGVTTVTVGNIIQTSTKNAFATDLASLKDAVDVYYIQNGELPVMEENDVVVVYEYNYNGMIDKNDTNKSISLNENGKENFNNELIQNGDFSDGEEVVSNTVFYKLDLNKLNVEKTKRGTGSNGQDDIYIIAYPSLTIYYLKGVRVEGVTYFSLLNLTEYQKVNNNESNVAISDEVLITELSGISVKREKKAWTNTLDITIEANLNDLEELFVRVPVRDEDIKLTSVVGQNLITLKSLSGSLQLTQEEINNFYELESSQRNLIILKKSNGIESGSIKINISNYDVEAPIVPLKDDGKNFDFTITSNDGYNVVSFDAKDDLSGIKEVRYIYLTEFNEQGIPQAVYVDENGEEITDFSSEYMLQNGKKAYVSESGRVDINLPKDIEAIYIAMYDKAGNSVRVTKNVKSDIYAGINLANITSDLLFLYAINTELNITNVTTSISSDGVTFTNEQVLTLTKNDNGVYTSTNSFVNNNYKEVYVKIVVKTDNLTETRIKKINISEKAYELINSVIPGIIYNENKTYTDSNGDSAILPAGFKVSSKTGEQTIDDGLVILDMQDNEYVWIPCTIDGADNTIKYAKWNSSQSDDYTVTKEQVKDDTLPTGISSETEQITKYGGFYVARYEAGLPDTQTTEELMLTKTFTADDNNTTNIGKAQSKPDKIVWNNINYINAKAVSEAVISNDYVQSGLITGAQWDTMLAFLSEKIDVDTDCTLWGNYYNKYGYTINGYHRTGTTNLIYSNSEYTKSTGGYLLLTTGKFGSVVSEGSPKNIYDVAGNVWELCTETVAEPGESKLVAGYKIIRGGSYVYNGYRYIASSRYGLLNSTGTYPDIGFRFVLYVK